MNSLRNIVIAGRNKSALPAVLEYETLKGPVPDAIRNESTWPPLVLLTVTTPLTKEAPETMASVPA